MKPLSILLVEDDAMIGALLAEMLAGLGYKIGAIQATEEGAVAAAARHKPDLMIVDIRLAEGTGIAAVERITQTGPIPHVFMSGLGRLAGTPGAVLLTKPFREADLIRAIARALDQASVGVAE
ncbi:MAG: response regulator [Acetobacteraceae bacterium]